MDWCRVSGLPAQLSTTAEACTAIHRARSLRGGHLEAPSCELRVKSGATARAALRGEADIVHEIPALPHVAAFVIHNSAHLSPRLPRICQSDVHLPEHHLQPQHA